jgi:hypothetical protein
MPNGTDLTDFLKAGYNGLNFAIAEGVENYHQPTDNYQNLDRGSAYHFLLTTQELSTYAAHTQFQDKSKQDGVYFPFWPGNLVLMSKTVAYGLSGLAVFSAVAWIVLQIRRKKVQLKQIAVGTGWLLGTVATSGLLSWGVVSVLTSTMKLKETSNTETVFFALSIALAIGVLALFSWQMRKLTLSQAVAGLLPVILLLAVATTVLLPTASYLFVLPTLALLALTLLEQNTIAKFAASTVIGVGILLLFVPVCWILYLFFLLPASPVVMALGVIPIAMITALFMSGQMQAKVRNR